MLIIPVFFLKLNESEERCYKGRGSGSRPVKMRFIHGTDTTVKPLHPRDLRFVRQVVVLDKSHSLTKIVSFDIIPRKKREI
jgi:hypothetical protein